MENFIFCVNAVLPSFLLIASGTIVRRVGWLDDSGTKQLNKLCFYLLLPLLMFRAAYNSSFSDAFEIKVLIISVLCLLGAIVLMLIIAPRMTRSRGQIGVMAQASFRSNVVMLGIAFATSLSGEAAGAQMGVMVALVVPLYNVLAIVLFSIYSDKPSQKINLLSIISNVAANPLIIMSFLGFLLSYLNIALPDIVLKPVYDLATAGSILAMLGVGAQLNFKNALSNIKLTLTSGFVKLVLLPAVGTYIALTQGMSGPQLTVLFLILATPNATGCAPMADIMGADGPLAAEMVVFSTAASVVTIFLGSFALKSLGLI